MKKEEIEKQRDEYLDGWQRAKAELINYKKEEGERLERLLSFSLEKMIVEILPIVDDLERAEESISDQTKELEEVQGLLQIKKVFDEYLERMGVKRLEILNTEFDPRTAESIEEVEDDKDEGLIVEVVQAGYMLDDKVIRPARVKISKKK